ncbi:hypothetical protein OV090_36925 [Nannocystis sp. RBIL2]|uniref:hypothetical protein n=1 Tax=Nannocystis sp. RBIL2 TaxID=2996788 RepID=UPI00226D82FF|nr:hypothetical protein [Nannocystis sp. RBIL2]MCY1070386.1 hypothetical protein [Nannocystis sp. RBIL2]
MPNDTELCSWNWFGDNDHLGMMEVLHSERVASCIGDGGYPQGNFPEWYSPPHDEGCVGQAPGGGDEGGQSSATSGTEPTTGAPTTTEASSSTTGEDDDGPGDYYCSLLSRYKCADITPDDALGTDLHYNRDLAQYPSDALYDACWTSKITYSGAPQWTKCVYNALDVDDARSKCQDACEALNTDLDDKCDNVGCSFQPIDCVLDGNWTDEFGTPHANDNFEKPKKIGTIDGYECDGEVLVIGEGPFTQFEGSGTIITPDGHSAGMTDVRGFLSYSLSSCSSTTCTITIDTLVGLTSHAEGGYTDAAGSGGTYELQQIGFQIRAPFSGTWDKIRKNITFPTDVMQAQFWGGPVLIDGVTVTDNAGVLNAEIDQIVGSLQSTTGPLTLNLTYQMSLFGTASASLQTVP